MKKQTSNKVNQAIKSLLVIAILLSSLVMGQDIPAITGTFEGADRIHQGAGSFELIEQDGERIIQFSEDFSVTRGPDLFVWLVKGDNTKEFVNLGRLENRQGTQSYVIPEDVNLVDFDRVIIWCRAFRVLFATAEFEQ